MSDAVSLPPGTLLADKFRVERLLGEGAMGAVYEVRHELTRHRRALKLLHATVRHVPDLVRRFLNEASAAGRAGSPHLVETFDAGTLPSGEPYVVMELLEGETLGSALERAPRLEASMAAEFIAQAAEGMEAAHRAGIIHRDLKPDNLFVTTRDGRPFVKILDFGVSKFATLSGEHSTRTRAGAIMGSPAFMSPEQLLGSEDLDERTDVYALGVVLYSALTGSLPFEGPTLEALALRVLKGEARPIDTMRPDVPAALVAVTHRALAMHRVDRFPSMRELAVALGPFRPHARASMAPLGFVDTAYSEPPSATIPGVPNASRMARVRWLLSALAMLSVVTAMFLMRVRSPSASGFPAASVAPPVAAVVAPAVALPIAPIATPAPTQRDEPALAPSALPVHARPPKGPMPANVATIPSSAAAPHQSTAARLGLHQTNPFR